MAELFELDTNKTSSGDAPAKPAVAKKEAPRVNSDEVAQDQLRAFVERIERMEEEKKAISDDIHEIYSEAKGNGFDTKVLRQVIKRRKQDRAERDEQDALLALYEGIFG